MIGAIGSAAALTAVLAAIAMTVTGAAGAAGRDRVGRWAPISARVLLAGTVAAALALEAALLTDDFSIRYVAEHHARSTPFPFDIATAWAALEGSIVLWAVVLAGYVVAVARRVTTEDRLGLAALSVLGVIALFFTGVIVTVADPFTAVSPIPADGPGPNPLLQNHILMAVHPPLLYLGYVGFSVPFAFGMAALALGDARRDWLRRTRRWTLTAWTFLTAGIAVGALWSYEVLGWGGYWAWDPVENASFLPWLTATAFIHSSLGQARRGVLRSWNVLLVIATFTLTIVGTFLTRSGVVASVHSFTQSEIGPALLGFIVVILVASLGLFAGRAHVVAATARVERMGSREGAFLVNNLLLSVLTVVVLVGTTYPIVLEALTGSQVSVGRPFFDRFAIPIGAMLLAAAAVGPLLPYRASRPAEVARRLRWALLAAASVSAVLAVTGVPSRSVVIMAGLATLVVGAVVVDAVESTRDLPGARLRSFLRLTRRNRAWWGGQVSHVGLAVIAVAIAVTGALGVERDLSLGVGESAEVGGYTLRFDGLIEREEPNRQVRAAAIAVIRDGEQVEQLTPRLNLYTASRQAIGAPSVRTTATHDLYLALRRLEADEVALEVYVFPFMWMVWAGAFLVVAGGAWALLGLRREPPSSTDRVRRVAHEEELIDA